MVKYNIKVTTITDFTVEAESGPLAEDIIYDAWENEQAWFQFEMPNAKEGSTELDKVTAREAWVNPAGQA